MKQLFTNDSKPCSFLTPTLVYFSEGSAAYFLDDLEFVAKLEFHDPMHA